jgi:hypothetical protein
VNPLPSASLDLAILLWKEMQHRDIHARQVTGELPIGLDFGEIETALDEVGLLITADASQRKIEFILPIGFFGSLEELISTSERRISPPKKFYLADCGYLYEEQAINIPTEVQNYLDATRFYSFLGDAADYKGGIGSTKTLVFLQKEKLEITPDYTIEDICELPNVDGFNANFISADTHKEQKLTIVRTVLLEIFKGRTNAKFSELLRQFGDFMERLNCSYQLYVSEFSFQKVKEEIEKEKLEATIKLNKVFSDIQNQLLAVPAALVLVGGQMTPAGNWTIKNLSIWLGFFIFAILMSLLVRNQRHTLKAVKQEIDQQWQQIKGRHALVADRFESSYGQLDKRYKQQELLIGTVSFLVAISLAASTGMLLWYSVPKNLMLESIEWGLLFSVPLAVWDFLYWLTRFLPESARQALNKYLK